MLLRVSWLGVRLRQRPVEQRRCGERLHHLRILCWTTTLTDAWEIPPFEAEPRASLEHGNVRSRHSARQACDAHMESRLRHAKVGVPPHTREQAREARLTGVQLTVRRLHMGEKAPRQQVLWPAHPCRRRARPRSHH